MPGGHQPDDQMEVESTGAASPSSFLEEFVEESEMPQLDDSGADALGDYLDIVSPVMTPELQHELAQQELMSRQTPAMSQMSLLSTSSMKPVHQNLKGGADVHEFGPS
jgi:hypothetical protein